MNIEKFRKFLEELVVQTSRDETGKTIYEEGYKYSKKLSTPSEPVFLRN